MAIAWWKRFEDTSWFRRNKLRLKRSVGIEPRLSLDVEIEMDSVGDWSVVSKVLKPGDIVYAMGICDDIDFEKKLSRRYQSRVYAFDPTPYSVNWIAKQKLPTDFHFYPWAASGKDGRFQLYPRIDKHGKASKVMFTFHTEALDRDDGVEVEALRLDSMMRRLGHDKIDLLKMDVEGAEYDVLQGLLQSEIRPKMILVEFHHRFKGLGKRYTEQAVKSLKSVGYSVASISINGRELCFVHEQTLAGLGYS